MEILIAIIIIQTIVLGVFYFLITNLVIDVQDLQIKVSDHHHEIKRLSTKVQSLKHKVEHIHDKVIK